jgi:hypothetical protein
MHRLHRLSYFCVTDVGRMYSFAGFWEMWGSGMKFHFQPIRLDSAWIGSVIYLGNNGQLKSIVNRTSQYQLPTMCPPQRYLWKTAAY